MPNKRKPKAEDYDLNGCFNLIGAIIRQAILDYQKGKRKFALKNTRYFHNLSEPEYDSAKRFLFSPGHLEAFLHTYHLDGFIEHGYIRHMAENVEVKEDTKLGYTVSRRNEYDE